MSRKHQRRDYNGRQGSAQRPWEQQGGQGRGGMQRNQYDNIGRDRYGSNTGEGGGYGSRDWDRGDDEGSRPNWPGEQGRESYGSQGNRSQGYGAQGYGSQNYGAQRYDSQGYGSQDEERGEEYGDQRFGGGSSRRYRSQGYGGDQGMSRYQSGGYGQNYGDDLSRGDRGGSDRGYQNWGEGDAEYGGSNQSQRNFEEGNWHRGQGQGGRSGRSQSFGSEGFGGSQGGQGGSRSSRGMGSQGQYSGRGPKGYRRGDERIQEDISEQLTQHPEIDASEIEVKVSNGEVTLTGTVDNREAKRLAEDIAEDVSGVTDVQNQIRVQKTVGAARDEDEGSTSRGRAGKSGSSSSSTGSSSSEGSKSQNRTGAGIGS